ncbi:unnamed protein product [Arctia plantaginis]|uniref:Peptidase S1 domain-containing protein n=1 Tax=Arctia plantaginis TaxID=874455 RepID=A0A8S1BI15_ARCPL|nr:unnamed protein product [Arctia plantaginis]
MILKNILLCCVLVLKGVTGLDEGETCSVAGVDGVCTIITKCPSAIEAIKKKKKPQNCGFLGTTPIVCCVDSANTGTTLRPPVATTQRLSTSTVYIPDTSIYVDDDRIEGCEGLGEMTEKKIGQKAFDKCIDYQAELVYPCEKAVALTGDVSRASHCHHNADELIVGGNDTNLYEFPHMAMLGYGDNEQSIAWLCGGSIISNKYILTAAHCTFARSVGDVKYVLVGAQTRSDANIPSKIHKVKRIIKHPGYKPPSKYNDIALLETEKIIPLSQFVVPACLHIGDTVNDTKVLATGWGHTQYKGSLSEVMQKVIIEKFSTEECSVKYPQNRNMMNGFDPQTQSCYGDRTVSKDTCQGDSGGPIQIKSLRLDCMYVVVGVTSFGRACGFPAEPAIYTKVSHYVPWIESIVWP